LVVQGFIGSFVRLDHYPSAASLAGTAEMAYDLALRQSKISFALHRKRETGLPSFGEKLKQEREKRKITLEQISASTKIGTRMLQALEEDKFNQLPGGIFNKGFVRAYARVVGLDDDQTVAEYLQASGDAPAVRTELASLESGEREYNREDRLRENEEKERMSRLEAVADAPPRQLPWGLFAAALLLFALVLSLWSHRQREHARQQFRPAPTAAAPQSSGETLSSEKLSSEKLSGANGSASSSSSASPQNGATPGESAPSAATAGEFTVAIRAREESWISITADGKTVEAELLAAGSERSVAGRKEIIVRVGNAAGIDFRFDGKKVSTAGEVGEVRTVTFGPRGILPNAPTPASTP
jgi:cytoskeleton protein RodZ